MKLGIPLKNKTMRIFFGKVFNGWDILMIVIVILAIYGVFRFWAFLEFLKWISLFIITSVLVTWMVRAVFDRAKR